MGVNRGIVMFTLGYALIVVKVPNMRMVYILSEKIMRLRSFVIGCLKFLAHLKGASKELAFLIHFTDLFAAVLLPSFTPFS